MRRSLVYSAVLLLPPIVGCQSPWSAGTTKLEAVATPPMPSELAVPVPAAREKSAEPVPSNHEPAEQTESAALSEVLDGLSEFGAIDPAAKQQLMADLREAKPENWPLIVRQFRSALAFSQQLAQREAGGVEDAGVKQLPAETTTEKTTQPVLGKRTTQPSFASPSGASLTVARPLAVPVSFDVRQKSILENRQQSTAAIQEQPLPSGGTPPLPLAVTQQSQPLAQHVSYTTTIDSPIGWQAHLHSAIDDLRTSVQPVPGSTDEVSQHMRLRLLQLLSGNEEAALQSIPGASAEQQDYWNQQLFAVSTFLDSARQPDDKRRAAGSLMHLDQARAKLAELATMQVRKLAFVDSVAGYGSYKLVEAAKFRPGDHVTLYAEIDAFSSESTKEGYRTRLGTSYEVVDKNGKRVDSDQFPEVEDLCQNPRRDFHMQYTVVLPTRIYPEQYELRLNITDQQSQKIGQASVPFEIVE